MNKEETKAPTKQVDFLAYSKAKQEQPKLLEITIALAKAYELLLPYEKHTMVNSLLNAMYFTYMKLQLKLLEYNQILETKGIVDETKR